MNFSEILKEQRIKSGLSKKELAEMAGVTERAIYYWENGERIMSVENADKLFKAIGVTVNIGGVNEIK